MSDGRCATCKHWMSFAEANASHYSLHHQNGKAGKLGLCVKISEEIDVFRDRNDDIQAFAEDASDYSHHLRTAATFGCTLYEPKEG